MQEERELLDDILATVNEVSSMLHLAHRESDRRREDALDSVLAVSIGKLESIAQRIKEQRPGVVGKK